MLQNIRALEQTSLQQYIRGGNLQEGEYLRGGRLAFFAHRWPTSYHRRILKEGLRITWVRYQPPRMQFDEYAPRSPLEAEAIREEQQDLVTKRAVEKATEPFCVLPLFCIKKKNSKAMRPILNMKVLSPYIFSPKFKMEGMRAAKDLLRRNDWAVRVDLRDAYLHVKLHKEDRKYRNSGNRGLCCLVTETLQDSSKSSW